MYFLLAVFFLSGCLSNYKVLGLYPNHVTKSEIKTNGSLYFDKIIAFESVKSANVPILLKDGKLFTDKDFIWLRAPSALIEEYFKMRWEDIGGKWVSDSSLPKLKLILRNCYIDQQQKRFYVELQVIVDDKQKIISKDSNVLTRISETLIEAIEEGLEFVVDTIRK